MGNLRRRPKLPARPARQWEGDVLPTPRPVPVRVACNESALVAPIPKAEPLRSEAYLRFVASFPCFDCGVSGWSQAAHENLDKGLSLKVDDRRTFPLCAARYGLTGCHFQFDNYIERTRDECRDLGRIWVERMHDIARRAGRKEFA